MTVLFFIAVLLAWPTYGISILAYIGLIFFMANQKTKSNIHYSNENKAIARIQNGEERFPSWISDMNEVEIFMVTVQQLTERKGVPLAYFSAYFKQPREHKAILYYCGALELEGSSFIEQQVSSSELIVKIYHKFSASSDNDIKVQFIEGNAISETPDVQCSLGDMYEYGKGINRNYERAEHWYSVSSSRGYAKALEKLANLKVKHII